MITQDAVLATFDRILRALTLAVGGLAAISLAVAGILIMNVMLISVAQRRSEIGLLKALGATGREIGLAFITEAVQLALGGADLGLVAGKLLGQMLIGQLYAGRAVHAAMVGGGRGTADGDRHRGPVRRRAGAARGEA